MADETIVFVPGLNCTRDLFEPQIAALSASHPVVVADQTRDDTIAAMASRLLGEAPDRFALAGLSMGGYVALEVMRQAPHRVTRLALLDTTARPDTDEARDLRLRLIALAQAGRFREVHGLLWERLVHPDRRQDSALEETVRRMAEATGPEAFVRQQRAIIARRDARPGLPGIGIATLVVVGDADAITPPDHAQEMANRIPGASLAIVPACGHLSTLERPERVTQVLSEWLAE